MTKQTQSASTNTRYNIILLILHILTILFIMWQQILCYNNLAVTHIRPHVRNLAVISDSALNVDSAVKTNFPLEINLKLGTI